MLTDNHKKCTGCGACIQKCPNKCISWTSGEFGFLYPTIDESKCVHCGLCELVCPIEKKKKIPEVQKAYAAINQDYNIVMKSTSGGAFSALADFILNRNGVVYGAVMDENMVVKHIRAENREGVERMMGSKYIQSYIGHTFQQAEADLKTHKFVLYVGTPCQIAALFSYLGKEYERLITADIVCHGIGSQAYFDKYMKFAKRKYGNIKKINFRDKISAGWCCGGGSILIDEGRKEKLQAYYEFSNYYYAYYLSGDIYRECCYSCKYANMNREGDFTMGDFWGIEAYNTSLETRNGCSLLVINSVKAKAILEQLISLQLLEMPLEQALGRNRNLRFPSSYSKIRNELEQDFRGKTAFEIQELYVKRNRKKIFLRRMKTILPYQLRLYIRKIRG